MALICLIILGFPGKQGNPGPQGPPGPKGVTGGATGGVVYTRWGKKSCPNTDKTTKLYSGKNIFNWSFQIFIIRFAGSFREDNLFRIYARKWNRYR